MIVAQNTRFGQVERGTIYATVELLIDVTNETNADVFMQRLSVRWSDGGQSRETEIGDDTDDPNSGKFAPGQSKTFRTNVSVFREAAIRGVNTQTLTLWEGAYRGRWRDCGYPKVEVR